MPTYDYICKECGHEFEEFQQMSDDTLEICPSCERPSLKRIIGAGAGMIFKGSGFYLTDYKNKGNGSAISSTTKSNVKEEKTGNSGSSAKDSDSAASTKNESSSSSEKK